MECKVLFVSQFFCCLHTDTSRTSTCLNIWNTCRVPWNSESSPYSFIGIQALCCCSGLCAPSSICFAVVQATCIVGCLTSQCFGQVSVYCRDFELKLVSRMSTTMRCLVLWVFKFTSCFGQRSEEGLVPNCKRIVRSKYYGFWLHTPLLLNRVFHHLVLLVSSNPFRKRGFRHGVAKKKSLPHNHLHLNLSDFVNRVLTTLRHHWSSALGLWELRNSIVSDWWVNV